ncbi:hypothetical protein [Corynebacterium renale]|uniref:Uncharacterized protein n=1 Tax=Corynebacterium renale TaxID=1724 RepID=A0A2A9DP26_9CORY|nr:hypothetical protein [Corynebacterium renale]PFG27669.1 hypothetical protein ATK06_0745 [Corynebacterium renale]SQI22362.1 transposase for insertion sequence element [Corynebacterium renale]
MNAEEYEYRTEWSEEDQEYVATVPEFPSLSWLAPTEQAARAGAVALVAEVIADMDKAGELIPR